MDDFVDQFLSSSSWSDVNATERSSWVGNSPAGTNGLLPSLVGPFEGHEKNSPADRIPSSHVVESYISHDPSLLLVEQSSYGIEKSLLHGKRRLQQGGVDHESKISLLAHTNCSSEPSYTDPHLETSMSTLCTLNHGRSELLPVADGPITSPSLQPESGSVGSNDCEQSEFHPTLRDSHSLTSIPQLWHPSSYASVSSLSPVTDEDKLQGFGLQGQYLDTSATGLGNEYLVAEDIPRSNLYASLCGNGQDEMKNHSLLSLTALHHNPMGRSAEYSHSQLSQFSERNPINHFPDQSSIPHLPHAAATGGGGCNGSIKPRVRARRGQATDPHSIAERLRREKIAERMKNLQELVPNSNKTDKASMLDEIIEYVKFLQLQVKVLSMSRLGAAGAVVPLITDRQPEGSAGLHVSQSTGDPPFESPDTIAFEQEVVKLMESNVTIAMQFLQSKGICLMPIALASAISGRKAPSPVSVSSERKNPICTNGPTSIGPGQMSSDGGGIVSKETEAGICNREDILTNSCNGAGAVIKQEVADTLHTLQE